MLNIIKSVLFGIIEGITEWLPISSTGHLILFDQFVKLDVSKDFMDMYLVVIQLGAILAVVFLYWNKLFPFSFKGGFKTDKKKMTMWGKIIVATLPAAIIGLPFDDIFNALFYNWWTVAIMLILFGILFIIIENLHAGEQPLVSSIDGITYRAALFIGVFQLIAAVFPGTSRSGATIVAALMIGISRTTAAEFTFFLAIPAMFGASLIKVLKFGSGYAGNELAVLLVGVIVSFVVSVFAIKFLMNYIKKHDFKVFGWYRIILGIVVFGYFLLFG
ncbi:MAG: undecaprenyl-diphosphate phosphatase [Eubacteriaceae bacterium]|jgi:undecaprenyl-diphosphatase|nr:undecaprenyl-diphosphate phosphatase [Eubacteriaceae bacterium]MDD4508187.1 undecaprenyl-diphosphate phosphatase [Eubacteriaceae bacterium]